MSEAQSGSMTRTVILSLLVTIVASLAVSAKADAPAPAPSPAPASLTPTEIFAKAREAYAALASYTDQGTVIATLNGLTITTTFKIKLARPNLYRIEWLQANDSPFSVTQKKLQSVWSDGTGDFLDMLGQGPKKQASQEMALASATGISGGAAATIPSAFFKTGWGDQLGNAARNDKQQPDEKIGDTDCYVFSGSSKGRTSTIWIGKQDFLIRQVRTLTSAAAMKAVMDEAAKADPAVTAHMPAIPPNDLTSTETHTNLILNPKLAPPDFTH
jgi:outer membrane lipoprotein-sorting protein